MRAAILTFLLAIGVSTAHAQIQEKKLLDRLLKPDMSLQNSVQDKKFVAGGATVEKKARTKSFYVRETAVQKQFQERTRSFATQEFGTQTSRYDRTEANLKARSRIPNADVAYSTAGYSGVRVARDATKVAESNAFDDGTRPFLVRGKSQKALGAQDQPLTIDQVRELLNKNK